MKDYVVISHYDGQGTQEAFVQFCDTPWKADEMAAEELGKASIMYVYTAKLLVREDSQNGV